MCQLLSGWISIDGTQFYPGDCVHHENGAQIHGIDENTACPWEWTVNKKTATDEISVIVSPKAKEKGATAEWYEKLLRDKFGTRDNAINWCLLHINDYVNVDLRDTDITQLPDNLSVGGNLDLCYTKITQLPDNLSVAGNLDLYCTEITQLPDNLRVSGNLDLRLTQITQLPNNLSVGDNMHQ